jgi:hypothetical protein
MTVQELILLLQKFPSHADAIVAFCNGTACEIADVVEVLDNHGRAQICAEDWNKKLTAQANAVPIQS